MSEQSKADFALVIATLAAAMGWMFSGEVLKDMPPILFIGLRFLLAALLLLPLGLRVLARLDARALLKEVPTALVFALGLMSWILGLRYSQHVGIGGFIICLNALIAPCWRWPGVSGRRDCSGGHYRWRCWALSACLAATIFILAGVKRGLCWPPCCLPCT
ncbi:MAG: EamA family transporter [Thiolinea sp.]